MKNGLLCVVTLLVEGLSCVQTQASEPVYPSRPIRMIVGFAPGGAVDILARIVAQKLADTWGPQVVVDNRSGASGMIAAEITAKATPDGYTLLMMTSSHAISVGFYSKLNFHPMDSFAPITLIASTPLVLLASSSLPVKSISELASMAKANPGKLNFGSSGSASITHLAGELLKSMGGIDILHVPYKGATPALNDLIGGQIQLAFTSVAGALPQIKAGRVKAIAVTSAKRSPLLPDVSTIAESGLTGYEATNWYGILAPAGTSQQVVNKLHAQIVKIVQAPEAADAITKQGAEPEVNSPQAFGTYLKSEIAKWAKVVKSSSARAD